MLITRSELEARLTLFRRLERAIEREAFLRASVQPGVSVLSGLPHAPGYGDRVGDLAAEIADAASEVEALRAALRAGDEALEAFIRMIGDAEARVIVRLRYQRGLMWKEVAQVLGPYCTEGSVKRICYQQLRKMDLPP